MLFLVEVVGLEEVVVNVLHRDVNCHTIGAHRLEFQHHQRTQGVLQQGLMGAQSDFTTRLHRSADQVFGDEFAREALRRHDGMPFRTQRWWTAEVGGASPGGQSRW
ncbi:hypothetical protein ABT314_10240 [Streptomyces spiralis]